MAQVFITISRLRSIAKTISYLPISTNAIYEFYKPRLLDSFSIPERKALEAIKLILESIGNKALEINIVELHENAQIKLNENKHEYSRWIYLGSQPAYHYDAECKSLIKDYKNYEIPVEIKHEDIPAYREFFLENIDLYREHRDKYFARVEMKFNTKINNVKEVHAENSGSQSLTITTTDRLQTLININNLVEEMYLYKGQSKHIKRIVTNAGFNTKKALKQPCYYNNKEDYEIVKAWDSYKQRLEDLIIKDLICTISPEYRFDQGFLEKIGFRKCSKCFQN